jgi:regulator of replication initiation timing
MNQPEIIDSVQGPSKPNREMAADCIEQLRNAARSLTAENQNLYRNVSELRARIAELTDIVEGRAQFKREPMVDLQQHMLGKLGEIGEPAQQVPDAARLDALLKGIEDKLQHAYFSARSECCGTSRNGECCGSSRPVWIAEDALTMDLLSPVQRELAAILRDAASGQGFLDRSTVPVRREALEALRHAIESCKVLHKGRLSFDEEVRAVYGALSAARRLLDGGV